MKNKFVAFVFAALAVLGMVDVASATSLLDTTMSTAVSAGVTDIKDTIVALLAIVFGAVITITVLKRLPGMVKSFLGAAMGK